MIDLKSKVKSLFLSLDKFSEPIQVNFNRKLKIPSYLGSLVTIFCYSIVMVYAVQRFQKVLYR
jgi:maltodextrin utilization protein YvdJ